MNSAGLRAIPSVDKVLRELGHMDLPRPAVLAVIRRELAHLRADAADGQKPAGDGHAAAAADPLDRIRGAIDDLCRARIQPVVNGTGIIVHTNFGRAPLGPEVVRTISTVAANYNNLEYDLTGGARGGRGAYLEHNLAILCGAEAATVVNNCAAALVLVLRHFASKRPKRQVVISRGELVQIGGGFRIPEILQASGAQLREIGTTNKTTLDDYAGAIDARTAMILKVHRSNFYMGGFTDSPPTAEVATLARKHRIPFVEDLGSGATFPTEQIARASDETAPEHEPTPAEILSRGADLVCFSGDKLLGGPQAGVIAGGARHTAALKKEPFFRALRCDKLILAALQTTVDLHLARGGAPPREDDDAQLPILAMMRTSIEALRVRADRIVRTLGGRPSIRATIGTGDSQVGGGSLPRTVIPSVTLDLAVTGKSADVVATALRSATPPVVGYVANDTFKLDLRTIFPHQDDLVVAAVAGLTSA